ncbi:MAG TPA: tetratricopeptide repeat protein [Gemmataceae bacterium]|nr:tetratricopeptide repeat protein [Gemmataceae bacterium]
MTFSEQINDLFEHEKWMDARRLLEQRLKAEPDSHWLLTRLGTAYYEQKNYKKALNLSEKAYKLAPHCPLVLWDLASTLEMLGADLGAVKFYTQLFQKGVRGIAEDECGEGVVWAQSLLADCLYSVAGCLYRLGNEKAPWFIRQHLEWRAAGIKSIYSAREARDRLLEISGASLSRVIEQGAGEAGKALELVGT